MAPSNISSLARSIVQTAEKAINCDSWGQRLEAAEEYNRVYAMYHEGATSFCADDSDEKELIRIMNNIKRRAGMLETQTLSDSQKGQIGLDAVKSDCADLKRIVTAYQQALNRRKTSVVEYTGEKLLLPAPKVQKPGCSYLTIKIEKIGIKDAIVYLDPFMCVTVKDAAGEDLTPVQNTPCSYHIQEKYVIFNVNVHIQKPLEDLTDDQSIKIQPSKSPDLFARQLIAYSITKPIGRRNLCRAWCVPNVLLILLITLFGIATVQVALFHYYGTPNGHSVVAHPYVFHGGGPGMFPRFMATQPPRINLRALLSQNVPSIATNFRILQQQINVIAINNLLALGAKSKTPVTTDKYLNKHSTRNTTAVLKFCPQVPETLNGRIFADINHTHEENYTEATIAAQNGGGIGLGGWGRPSHCHPRHHVAVIIPYRDRKPHLMVLLAHLHPVLLRQQLNYRIYVVEQYGNLTFNKARIMNIAFVTALKQDPTFGCFIFHDVDLIPEDDRNMYSCPQQPRHMSVAIDEMNYQIPYEELVGGVFAIRTEHFFKVNGYSNLYWGWGAEDDDMAYRLEHVGLKIIRPPAKIGRYKMIRHKKRPAVDGRIRYRLLWTGVRRYKIDGLNSLDSLNYKVLTVREKPLYTHIMIDIGPPPPGF